MESGADEVVFDCDDYRIYRSGKMDRLCRPARAPTGLDPATGVTSKDVVLDSDTGVSVRLFLPTSPDPSKKLPILVFFHGGGFLVESAVSPQYHNYVASLAVATGVLAVSVEHRLAPEHPVPAAYDDAWAALSWAASGQDEWLAEHGDSARLFLAGDSAGGNITHHVAQRWSDMTTTASPSSLRLAGVVLIQPFFGGEERTEAEVTLDKVGPSLSMVVTDAYWREFLPEGATRDHPAARVCGERVELAEAFPPAMVVVGGFDLLKGWQTRYVEALRGKGKPVRVVEYPDAIHGFHAFPEIADSGKLVEDIKLFVDERRPTKL